MMYMCIHSQYIYTVHTQYTVCIEVMIRNCRFNGIWLLIHQWSLQLHQETEDAQLAVHHMSCRITASPSRWCDKLDRSSPKRRRLMWPWRSLAARSRLLKFVDAYWVGLGTLWTLSTWWTCWSWTKQVQNAMKFVFGPYMVCDTAETAKQITFHPNVRVKTVTKDQQWDPFRLQLEIETRNQDSPHTAIKLTVQAQAEWGAGSKPCKTSTFDSVFKFWMILFCLNILETDQQTLYTARFEPSTAVALHLWGRRSLWSGGNHHWRLCTQGWQSLDEATGTVRTPRMALVTSAKPLHSVSCKLSLYTVCKASVEDSDSFSNLATISCSNFHTETMASKLHPPTHPQLHSRSSLENQVHKQRCDYDKAWNPKIIQPILLGFPMQFRMT